MKHATLEEIKERLATAAPPSNQLIAITARPDSNERITYQCCELTIKEGVPQDRWIQRSWVKLPDGASDPQVQVTLISLTLMQAIEPNRDRWVLAGDNLIVDFDLSHSNLPIGSRIQIGSAILEMTEVPHTACAKFKERFGEAAFVIVNAKDYTDKALRGRHAKVVQNGTIRIGDLLKKDIQRV